MRLPTYKNKLVCIEYRRKFHSILTSFKQQLNKISIKVPVYYSSSSRLLQIHHTRLRTNCSSLNQRLHSKNIINDPLCACGNVDTTHNFLLEGPQYIQARRDLITTLSTCCVPSLYNLFMESQNLITTTTS